MRQWCTPGKTHRAEELKRLVSVERRIEIECSGEPHERGVDEQMLKGGERKKMPGRHQEEKISSTEEATSSKRTVAPYLSRSAGMKFVVGAMLQCFRDTEGSSAFFSEQAGQSAQDSEQRTSKDKRPKVKTKSLHVSIQDTATWNLVPVTNGVLNI